MWPDLLDAATAILAADGRVVATAGLAEARDGGRLGDPQLAVPISAGGRHHGRLPAFERGRAFGAEDRLTLENAATVAALAITKSQAVAAVEAKFRSDFLHDLVGGRVATVDEAVSRGDALGWRLDRPTLVAVAEVDERPGERVGEFRDRHARLVAAASAWAVRSDPHAAVVDLGREAVLITGTPPGTDTREASRDHARCFHAEIRAAAVETPVAVGVGRIAEDALAIPGVYRQATRAIEIGRQTGAAGAVAHFDDLGVRLLSLVPEVAELRAFVRESLGPLAGGEPRAVDLRRTLATLLDVNLNVAEAARRLHFHYNTMRYRIDKLEALVGPFTADPQLRLNVALALQVLRMRGYAEGQPSRSAPPGRSSVSGP